MARTRWTLAFDHANMTAAPKGVVVPKTIFKTEDGIVTCYGTTKPTDASAGYAPGCIFIDSDSGVVYVNEGSVTSCAFAPLFAVAQQDAPTDALTDITQAGTFTPDYAVQALTSTTPFGFANAAEGETVVSIVQNNKTRIAEIEAALVALGLLAS